MSRRHSKRWRALFLPERPAADDRPLPPELRPRKPGPPLRSAVARVRIYREPPAEPPQPAA